MNEIAYLCRCWLCVCRWLWTRAWPSPDRTLIDQAWKPHMNGAVPLSAALDQLVQDLAQAQQPQPR